MKSELNTKNKITVTGALAIGDEKKQKKQKDTNNVQTGKLI
jgi:hypothetical protein